MLVEDRSINRMEESLLLFQHIVTYDVRSPELGLPFLSW